MPLLTIAQAAYEFYNYVLEINIASCDSQTWHSLLPPAQAKALPHESASALKLPLLLQAVYGAFARFRARHCFGAHNQNQPTVTEPEVAAVSMLQHVSATAAARQSAAPLGADDIAPGGIKISPSQQSDMPSLAGAEAQQGSGDRSVIAVTIDWLQYRCIRILCNVACVKGCTMISRTDGTMLRRVAIL